MKNEEIAQKLEKLSKLYMQLKALREAQGDNFSQEDEDLLSNAELLEEALKNYMYQFGLSIYRNKKGKRFFKKFIHDEDEVRGFDELDNQCFEFQESEPSFLQRLLEYKPADRILMTKDIENTVEELYQKDQQMIDIFDELINEEAERCVQAIKETEIENNIEKTFDIQNEIDTPQINIEIDAPTIELSEIEKVIKGAGADILRDVKLFDIYRGVQVGPGRKSVAFKLIYRHNDRTLTEEDITSAHNKVLDALKEKLDINLREM